MNAPFDVLAIGNPCLDVVVHAARIPAWDEKSVGSSGGFFAGGTEANFACAGAALGLNIAVLGAVGDDRYSQFLLDEFARFGVDISNMRVACASVCATTVVLVSPAGERSALYVPMPEPAQATQAAPLPASRWIYSMPYDESRLRDLSRRARAAGAQVAIDLEAQAILAAGADNADALIGHADLVFMNESGFRAACGVDPGIDTLLALQQRGSAHTMVVTLGAAGALAADKSGARYQAAYPVEALDATGAGDTFNAAFLTAHLESRDLKQALQFACAAGAAAVTRVGARTAMPDRSTVDRIMAAGRVNTAIREARP